MDSDQAVSAADSPLTGREYIRIFRDNNNYDEIYDPVAASKTLCCRTYFYKHQILPLMRETARIEFKDYRFDEVAQSIDYDENDRLKKTISGFLNGEGGIIYLPIKEYVLQGTKMFLVQPRYQSSQSKAIEKLRRDLGLICQKIKPENPYVSALVEDELVPIFYQGKTTKIADVYKIIVHPGRRDQLYGYESSRDRTIKFGLRRGEQVLQRHIGQSILEYYSNKLRQRDNPTQTSINPISSHKGRCDSPSAYINQPKTVKKQYKQKQSIVQREKESQRQLSQECEESAELQSSKNTHRYLIYKISEEKLINILAPLQLGKYSTQFTSIQEEGFVIITLNNTGKELLNQPKRLTLLFQQQGCCYKCQKITRSLKVSKMSEAIKEILDYLGLKFKQSEDNYRANSTNQNRILQFQSESTTANAFMTLTTSQYTGTCHFIEP